MFLRSKIQFLTDCLKNIFKNLNKIVGPNYSIIFTPVEDLGFLNSYFLGAPKSSFGEKLPLSPVIWWNTFVMEILGQANL